MYQFLTYRILYLLIFIVQWPAALSQEAGPVLSDFGKVHRMERMDIPVDTQTELWAVFDVSDSPSSPTALNPQIETAARFLNLHVGSGIARERLKVALVVHGDATEDLLRPEVYSERHGKENPNAELVRQLLEAGVEIAVCCQSARSRNMQRADTLEGVQWALSAMTALIHYQNLEYQFIKF